MTERQSPRWLEAVLDSFPDLRVAVIGDFALDAYWHLDSDRTELSLETGRPVQHVRRQRYALGGAGNVAAMVAAWRIRGIVSDEEDSCAAAVGAFVRAYEERSGAPLVGFAPFETLALAERTHHLSGQTADRERLLAMAEARLEGLQ